MDPIGMIKPAFVFRKRSEKINWKKLAAVDISKISQELDFKTLQDNIVNVAFSNIDIEIDTTSVDPNFIKLFNLAQLIIEYLLHSQDYLSSHANSTDEKLIACQLDNKKIKEELSKSNELIIKLKKENRRRRILLETHQSQITEAQQNNYFQCHICHKVFMSSNYLQAHVERRHDENFSQTKQLDNEVESLRKRCLDTEKRLGEEVETLKSLYYNDQKEILNIEKSIKSELTNWKSQILDEEPKLEHFKHMIDHKISNLREEQMNRQNESEATIKSILSQEVRKINEFNVKNDNDKHSKIISQQIESTIENCIQHYQDNLQRELEVHFNQSTREMKNVKSKHKKEVKDLKDAINKTQEDINNHMRSLAKDKSVPVARKIVPNSKIKLPAKQEENLQKDKVRAFIGNSSDSDSDTYLKSVEDGRSSTLSYFPRAKKATDLNLDLLDGLKEELVGLLGDKLKEIGISPNSTAISSNIAKSKLSILGSKRKEYTQKFKTFSDFRSKLDREIDDAVEQRSLKIGSPKTPRKKLSYNTEIAEYSNNNSGSLHEVDNTVLERDNDRKSPKRLVAKKEAPVPVPRSKGPMLTSTTRQISRSSSEESVDISLSDLSDIKRPKTASPLKKAKHMEPEEDSDWDSISDIEAIPIDNDHVYKMKKPTGTKVEELTKSIEHQLSEHRIKPAGGVDLLDKNENAKRFSMSKQSYLDDEFSSLSLSDVSETLVKASRRSSLKSGSEATSVWGSTAS